MLEGKANFLGDENSCPRFRDENENGKVKTRDEGEKGGDMEVAKKVTTNTTLHPAKTKGKSAVLIGAAEGTAQRKPSTSPPSENLMVKRAAKYLSLAKL